MITQVGDLVVVEYEETWPIPHEKVHCSVPLPDDYSVKLWGGYEVMVGWKDIRVELVTLDIDYNPREEAWGFQIQLDFSFPDYLDYGLSVDLGFIDQFFILGRFAIKTNNDYPFNFQDQAVGAVAIYLSSLVESVELVEDGDYIKVIVKLSIFDEPLCGSISRKGFDEFLNQPKED